jgi:hypothetical protein
MDDAYSHVGRIYKRGGYADARRERFFVVKDQYTRIYAEHDGNPPYPTEGEFCTLVDMETSEEHEAPIWILNRDMTYKRQA